MLTSTRQILKLFIFLSHYLLSKERLLLSGVSMAAMSNDHTYKLTQEDGQSKYVKIQLKTRFGIQSPDHQAATKMEAVARGRLTATLLNSIEKRGFPI